MKKEWDLLGMRLILIILLKISIILIKSRSYNQYDFLTNNELSPNELKSKTIYMK